MICANVCLTSKKLLKKLLEPYAHEFEAMEMELPEPRDVASKISKAKAKGRGPNDLLRELPAEPRNQYEQLAKLVAEVYDGYQRALRGSNSLDFDDLLLRGENLFRDFPECAQWCKHILVDES